MKAKFASAQNQWLNRPLIGTAIVIYPSQSTLHTCKSATRAIEEHLRTIASHHIIRPASRVAKGTPRTTVWQPLRMFEPTTRILAYSRKILYSTKYMFFSCDVDDYFIHCLLYECNNIT